MILIYVNTPVTFTFTSLDYMNHKIFLRIFNQYLIFKTLSYSNLYKCKCDYKRIATEQRYLRSSSLSCAICRSVMWFSWATWCVLVTPAVG